MNGAAMFNHSIVIPPKLRHWGVYALILLAPGSLVILPAWWLLQLVTDTPRREAARVRIRGVFLRYRARSLSTWRAALR